MSIKSIRETLNVDYVKPDESKVDKFITDLQENQKALDYLKYERGFNEETIKHFKLGYDVKRDAISIPVYKNRELVNIKYRLLNSKKQKYSSERDAENWIYNEKGIDHGKAKGTILVVEGEFDLMACWQVGITNVVSPALGKNSYGVWIELLDNIPKIWLAYDNDDGGKETAYEIAERLGLDKCNEIVYPDDIKDANEYFKKFTVEDYRELTKNSKPFYKHQFKGLGEVIESFRAPVENIITSKFIPEVRMEPNWMVTAVAESGDGKTTWALNVVDDLVNSGHRVLFLPIENGTDFVGKRLLGVMYDKDEYELRAQTESEWNSIISDCIDKPIYFATPALNDVFETIIKAKRLFDVNVVVIDLLDLLISESKSTDVPTVKKIIHEFKKVCIEHNVTVIGLVQFRKDQSTAMIKKQRTMQDINGPADYYTQPQCVLVLEKKEDELEVRVEKNKGLRKNKSFKFRPSSGKLSNGMMDDFEDELKECANTHENDELIDDAVEKF